MGTASPTLRALTSHLFSSLATSSLPSDGASAQLAATGSVNSLPSLPPAARQALLTLHVLYPSLVLAALDLLDRSLVARLQLSDDTTDALVNDSFGATSTDIHNSPPVLRHAAAYLVTSSRETPRHHRAKHFDAEPEYQPQVYFVRLDAWHCSCPGFAFALYPASGIPERDGSMVSMADAVAPDIVSQRSMRTFIGEEGLAALAGDDVPLCKHLLACVLGSMEAFAGAITDREISLDELAGWAAGWGG